MNKFRPIPWFYILLDLVGALLLVVGILALVGLDFGNPALGEMAPFFLAVGVLLMVPLLIWVIQRVRS